MKFTLTPLQEEIVEFPDDGVLFVTGKAGTGKTTASVERLLKLLTRTDDPDSILILAPQKSLLKPYEDAIGSVDFQFPSPQSLLTMGGLAQRSISLFWPLIAKEVGFKQYKKNPVFLSLELTQFYLSRVIDPLLEQGYFSNISIDKTRLYSQIIDNLNKCSVVGLAPETISTRLSNAWAGKPDQTSIFDQAQDCALRFRTFCLENNLLDFSLQIQVFRQYLWKSFLFRQYLNNKYHHLIFENIEEDFPVAHDIIQDWLPDLQSAVLIYDEGGGFRTFLGADPVSAARFRPLSTTTLCLEKQLVSPKPISEISSSFAESILDHKIKKHISTDITNSMEVQTYRFYPEAIDAISRQVEKLIGVEGISPSEISLLTPFLSDSLLFSTVSSFELVNIPIMSYRPSKGLRDEPAAKTLLTLAKIAFPGMGFIPDKEDVRYALMGAISGCDLIRADLLTQMLYSSSNMLPVLRKLDTEKNALQSRITHEVALRYERLREWLADISEHADTELDIFFSRLFGELLSQEGFNFHTNTDFARVVYQLIGSSRNFRRTVNHTENLTPIELGKIYIQQVENGLLSSLTSHVGHNSEPTNTVVISPAHSFLMKNKTVQYQFWLDIGSNGWWTRLDQPLTQPYVLSRNWKEGDHWSDVEEFATNQRNLARIVQGLLNRCSKKVFLIAININQQGDEERGALMLAIQTILKKIHQDRSIDNV
jgi:hypothetical protein